MKGRYLADICCGAGKVGKAGRALGFAAHLFDKELGPAGDILDAGVVRGLKHDILRDKILAAMLAPTCRSWSLPYNATKFARSSEHPWGRPDLEESTAATVADDNALMTSCLGIIHALQRRGVPWALEHPLGSRFWHTSEVAALLAQRGVRLVELDQCQYGTIWRKATRLLLGNCDDEDAERLQLRCCARGKVCSRTCRPHQVLEGAGPGGVRWTRIAQVYPQRLARDLAYVLLGKVRCELTGV